MIDIFLDPFFHSRLRGRDSAEMGLSVISALTSQDLLLKVNVGLVQRIVSSLQRFVVCVYFTRVWLQIYKLEDCLDVGIFLVHDQASSVLKLWWGSLSVVVAWSWQSTSHFSSLTPATVTLWLICFIPLTAHRSLRAFHLSYVLPNWHLWIWRG